MYLVQDLEDKKEYAAKCIEKTYFNEHPVALRNLIEEIKILYECDHPYVSELFNVYETPDCIYLIMEYFPHGDLYKRISSKKVFSEETCAKFAKNMLEVLDYLDSIHVIHRDLKLENIMMTSDNDFDFKLADFGLAYENVSDHSERCGSPGYIAPEVLKKCKYNSKIDVFSAGVILYILMTGNHPFNDSSSDKILEKNKHCIYKTKTLKSEIARDFIVSMMTADPNERPSAAQLLEHPWIFNCRRGSTCPSVPEFSTRMSLVYDVNDV